MPSPINASFVPPTPFCDLAQASGSAPIHTTSTTDEAGLGDSAANAAHNHAGGLSNSVPSAASAHGPGDPPDLAALVRQLDELLSAVGSGKGAAAHQSEAAAVAAAARGRELCLLRGYGAVRQVPKRLYTIEELRLNRVEAEKLLSPKASWSVNVTAHRSHR